MKKVGDIVRKKVRQMKDFYMSIANEDTPEIIFSGKCMCKDDCNKFFVVTSFGKKDPIIEIAIDYSLSKIRPAKADKHLSILIDKNFLLENVLKAFSNKKTVSDVVFADDLEKRFYEMRLADSTKKHIDTPEHCSVQELLDYLRHETRD